MDINDFAQNFIANDNWYGYMEKSDDLEKFKEIHNAFEFYKSYDKSDFDFDEFCEDYWHQPA